MTENSKPQKKPYGFIIYRGDYSDDAQWDRYMAYLKHQTRCGLESEDELYLYERMDWKVVSSPDLDDVEPEEICRRFNEWLESGEEETDYNHYRHRACLYVDKGALLCLDEFMKGKSLETDNDLDLFDYQGYTYAILVSRFKEEGYVWVGMSFLMPRAGEIMLMQGEGRGWVEICIRAAWRNFSWVLEDLFKII